MARELFRTQVLARINGPRLGDTLFYQPPVIKIVCLVLAVLFTLFLTLAANAQIRQSERIRGYLGAVQGENKVFAARPGLLQTLNVVDGEMVQAGDVLAVLLDPSFDTQGSAMMDNQHAHVQSQLANLSQRIQAVTDRHQLEVTRTTTHIEALQLEIDMLQQELDLHQNTLQITSADYQANAALLDRGLIAEREFNQVRLNQVAAQQQLLGIQQQIRQRSGALSDAQLHLQVLSATQTNDVLMLQHSQLQLTQRRDELQGLGQFAVTAPVSGLVKNLFSQPGDMLDTRQPLFTIVAPNQALEAWLYLPSRVLADVREGQAVMLSYDAFPYQTYGSFPAIVTSVSNALLDPREHMIPLNLAEPVFLVRAQIEHTAVKGKYSADARPLFAGMQFSADIVTGQQTLVQRIFAPLSALGQRL